MKHLFLKLFLATGVNLEFISKIDEGYKGVIEKVSLNSISLFYVLSKKMS